MKHLIKILVDDIAKDTNNFERYYALAKSDGWQMHLRHMEKLKLLMSVDMLDESFTKLSAEEKDIRQRTYAGIAEVLNFLQQPFKDVQKKAKLKAVENKARWDSTAFKPHKGATFGQPKGSSREAT